ncbi:MAG: hypothetical protein Q9187_006443 [Circinaria calcarea]
MFILHLYFPTMLCLSLQIPNVHQALASSPTNSVSNSSFFTASSNSTVLISNETSITSTYRLSSHITEITETFTLVTAGILVLPEGPDPRAALQSSIVYPLQSSVLTLTGPTTVTAAWVDDKHRRPTTHPPYYLYESTFTLDEGTIQFDVGEGKTYSLVTLVGPTTATITASEAGDVYYDAFSAYDNTADTACHGNSFMGVHTSVTLAFDPSELSTAIILNEARTEFFPFDFTDAQCPPSSLSLIDAWTPLGLDGIYNPVVSAPPGLTLLDPNWNQDCVLAPFQGNDPPYALVPATNIVAGPTEVSPAITATPASPNSGIPLVPIQTTSLDPALSTQAETNQPHDSDPLIGSGGPVSETHTSKNPNPTVDPNYSESSTLQHAYISNDPGEYVSQSAGDPLTVEFTVAGDIYTADSASIFVINGQTLTPGGIITVSGTPISLAISPSQTDIVIGTSTQPLGDIIMGGFNSFGNDGGSSTITPFEGKAMRIGVSGGLGGGGMVLIGVGASSPTFL